MSDPVEKIIRDALVSSDTRFSDDESDPQNCGLDFYLPDDGIHIEVKAYASDTDRASRQLRQAENVLLLQGKLTAHWLADVMCMRKAESRAVIVDLKAENERLRGALDNLTIAVGMGWDLDGVLENARTALSPERVES